MAGYHTSLPSLANFHCQDVANTPACPLSRERGSSENILSCCQKLWCKERYRRRHHQALRARADAICTGTQTSKHPLHMSQITPFVWAPRARGSNQAASELGKPWKFRQHITKDIPQARLGLDIRLLLVVSLSPGEDRPNISSSHRMTGGTGGRLAVSPPKLAAGPLQDCLGFGELALLGDGKKSQQRRRWRCGENVEAAVDQTQSGSRRLDTSQRLITLGWVGQAGVYDAQRPETPQEAPFVTEMCPSCTGWEICASLPRRNLIDWLIF